MFSCDPSPLNSCKEEENFKRELIENKQLSAECILLFILLPGVRIVKIRGLIIDADTDQRLQVMCKFKHRVTENNKR